MVSRRTFIKSSLIAGGVLSAGAIFYSQIPDDEFSIEKQQLNLKFLNESDILVLLALVPVIVAGNELTPEKINNTIKNIDNSILLLSEKTRLELRELFDLLSSKLGRAVIVGIWASWNHAKAEDVVEFLQDWQNSFINLFQIGYLGLKELVCAGYYCEKDNWQQIGYAGPPLLF